MAKKGQQAKPEDERDEKPEHALHATNVTTAGWISNENMIIDDCSRNEIRTHGFVSSPAGTTMKDRYARRFVCFAPVNRTARGSRIEPCGGADVKGGEVVKARDTRRDRLYGKWNRTRASDDPGPLTTDCKSIERFENG